MNLTSENFVTPVGNCVTFLFFGSFVFLLELTLTLAYFDYDTKKVLKSVSFVPKNVSVLLCARGIASMLGAGV